MILAFTGAGISAQSGVPTFQEQPGIRDRLSRSYARRHPEKYQATICHFQTYFSSCPFVEVQHHTLHVACQVLLRNQKHKAKKLLKQLVV